MTVVFLGRLVPRKGCRQLIDAFSRVTQTLPEAKLKVGGTGPQLNELQELVESYGISENVEFLGFIPDETKADFLASGAVACFPSLGGESFGIVLIEAMAAGAGCVIAGSNPGYQSVISDNDLLFNPNAPDQLAEKIIDLLKDDKKRSMIGKRQSEQVKQYDINVVGPQLVDIYRAAIANHGKIRHN